MRMWVGREKKLGGSPRCPSEPEGAESPRCAEQHGAAGRDNQQCALDPPRAVAIQQYADRDLSRREGQEIDRREETKIRCTERQTGRELVGDQRVDGSEQICKVKSDGER